MNRINVLILLLTVAVFAISCGSKQEQATVEDIPEVKESLDEFPALARNMTIYEVNIRQHTPEGTFRAFMEDLPRLDDLGVEILWIMPVQPIGLKNRKMSEEELGSYYSINSYSEVNPEFGTMADFKALVNKAHDLGMYVILDWVPNHTAWDHPWIEDYPEFYAKDEDGNITYESDWTDIALLDHSNEELRSMMIDEMAYWIMEADIDGFRCDHAGHEIPMILWEEAMPALNKMKNLFWLAEWDDPKMHPLFNATYSWGLKDVANAIGEGEANADELEEFLAEDLEKYGKEAYRMTFTTNHDENAWEGTVFERYGEGHKAFAVLMWTIKGMPMIYSGQEAGLDKRLKFFVKDSVDWSDPLGLQPFYASLVDMRKENEAIWSGLYGGDVEFVDDGNSEVISFARSKGNNTVYVVINLSSQNQEVQYTDDFAGNAVDYLDGSSISDNMSLGPWEYHVYVSNN